MYKPDPTHTSTKAWQSFRCHSMQLRQLARTPYCQMEQAPIEPALRLTCNMRACNVLAASQQERATMPYAYTAHPSAQSLSGPAARTICLVLRYIACDISAVLGRSLLSLKQDVA